MSAAHTLDTVGFQFAMWTGTAKHTFVLQPAMWTTHAIDTISFPFAMWTWIAKHTFLFSTFHEGTPRAGLKK